jgi:hypothetical protein
MDLPVLIERLTRLRDQVGTISANTVRAELDRVIEDLERHR